MKRYPDRALWDQIAYLAYHFNWSMSELLDLEHRQRVRLVQRVGDIDRRANDRTPSGNR